MDGLFQKQMGQWSSFAGGLQRTQTWSLIAFLEHGENEEEAWAL